MDARLVAGGKEGRFEDTPPKGVVFEGARMRHLVRIANQLPESIKTIAINKEKTAKKLKNSAPFETSEMTSSAFSSIDAFPVASTCARPNNIPSDP